MKKKFAMFAALCISMGLLAGCGNSESSSNSKPSNESQAEQEVVEENVIYESKNVKISYLGEDKSFMGPELKLKIENLSNQKINVQTRDVSVNDAMITTIFSSEVAPGKTATDSITLSESDLEDNNITEMEKVELSFHILDDSFNTIEDSDVVTINP